ncbi:chymotrypsinogen B isoform X2 [Daphnia magna]|uniref:chymotrypsinogen B isoform X2 n=1 Tax=Daphnia magna TaxID=35525 RepID=UPI001E1BBFA2|nr:chymotrypsinogen B isoform X2 [Daphnia magna]
MAMPKANDLTAAVFIAAITLLLGTANGSIYQTNDAIVFEFDRTWDGSLLAKRYPPSQSDYLPIKDFLNGGVIPPSHIPMMDPSTKSNRHSSNVQSYYSWLHYHPLMYAGARVAPESPPNETRTAQCGAGPTDRSTHQRIIGGSEAIPNSWPFVVGLSVPDDEGKSSIICGGSLISETKVLIAARCVERFSMIDMFYATLKLGMHEPDDSQATRRISQMMVHKDYNPKTNSFDIAILTMVAPVTFTKAISPVCLPAVSTNVDAHAGKVAYIMGWGPTISTKKQAAKLMKEAVSIIKVEESAETTPAAKLMQGAVSTITSEECKAIYRNPGQISRTMLCASSSVSDFCQGDIGGPLVLQASNGLWTQIGIASWSAGCQSETETASVYTNVALLRPWINTNMID